MGDHLEILPGPALVEKRIAGTCSHPAIDVHVEAAKTLLLASIHIIGEGVPCLPAGVEESLR